MKKAQSKRKLAGSLLAALLACLCLIPGALAAQPSLWALARKDARFHRFSTLFTAQDVRQYLSNPAGLNAAVDWCKKNGVTKVYIEEFRDGYQAKRAALEHARDRFRAEGFLVSGCVTTTRVGKPSTGWKEVAGCYTDPATQERLQSIFEYAAGLFDEIMIDDFWFTDCTCPECDAARRARTVTIGEHTYPVAGDSWEDYRCELMVRLSQDRLLAPAKRVNPKVRLIIKYPQWYDNFHMRGYEVVRETAAFDEIWVGTETRDYQDQHWGGTPQYEGCFIMRWLGGIGGAKCGGGWFDSLGTTPHTYVEQARQTVLGGARESMLFSYGSLQREVARRDLEALRANLPQLFAAAKAVHGRQPLGLAAYKPPNSHPEKEARVFDFVGMLGLPLVPCHDFPTNAPAAFFSVHSLKDPGFAPKLSRFIQAGKPVLLTDGLVRELGERVKLDAPNVQVLPVKGDPKSLLGLNEEQLDALRSPLLRPFKVSFRAPARVALYLFKGRKPIIENFNDQEAKVQLGRKTLSVPARGWTFSAR